MKGLILSRFGRYARGALLAAGRRRGIARDYARAVGTAMVAALFLALERTAPARACDVESAIRGLLQRGSHRAFRSDFGLLAGLAHLQMGRYQDALALFDARRFIDTEGIEIELVWRRALQGELALNRGDLERAASAFSAAVPNARIYDPLTIFASTLLNDLPTRDGLARVAIARGDLDDAVARYRALLAYGPQSHWVAPYEPLYVFNIARLLEKKGDRIGAVEEYRRFLEFWKNADADLPELAEARLAIARLR